MCDLETLADPNLLHVLNKVRVRYTLVLGQDGVCGRLLERQRRLCSNYKRCCSTISFFGLFEVLSPGERVARCGWLLMVSLALLLVEATGRLLLLCNIDDDDPIELRSRSRPATPVDSCGGICCV